MIYRHSLAKYFILALLLGLLFTINIFVSTNIHQQLSAPLTKLDLGVNVDMASMIPNTPYTIKTTTGGNFFDLAAQLGINTLRITDNELENSGQEYSRTLWRYVFDESERHHMHVILLIEDGKGHSAIQQMHMLLNDYGLVQSPALWLIDLYNEPDLSDPRLMAMLREEAAYVHQIAPAIPITIGGWKSQDPEHPGKFIWQNPADIPRFINLVNVVSAHLYEFEEGTQQGFTPRQWTQRFLSAVRQDAMHKPILLEEFGAGNGLAPTKKPKATGSPTWQDYVYRGVLQEVSTEYDQGVIGAVAWIFAPRPPEPHPSRHNFEGDMTGWALVLNHGQHLLPAAWEFSAVMHNKQ